MTTSYKEKNIIYEVGVLTTPTNDGDSNTYTVPTGNYYTEFYYVCPLTGDNYENSLGNKYIARPGTTLSNRYDEVIVALPGTDDHYAKTTLSPVAYRIDGPQVEVFTDVNAIQCRIFYITYKYN